MILATNSPPSPQQILGRGGSVVLKDAGVGVRSGSRAKGSSTTSLLEQLNKPSSCPSMLSCGWQKGWGCREQRRCRSSVQSRRPYQGSGKVRQMACCQSEEGGSVPGGDAREGGGGVKRGRGGEISEGWRARRFLEEEGGRVASRRNERI